MRDGMINSFNSATVSNWKGVVNGIGLLTQFLLLIFLVLSVIPYDYIVYEAGWYEGRDKAVGNLVITPTRMRYQGGTDVGYYNGFGTIESRWGYDGGANSKCLYVAASLEVPNGEIEDLCDACTASAGFVTVIGYISSLLVIVMMITTLLRLGLNNFNTDMIKTIQLGCGFSISILMFFGFVSFKGACQAVLMEGYDDTDVTELPLLQGLACIYSLCLLYNVLYLMLETGVGSNGPTAAKHDSVL